MTFPGAPGGSPTSLSSSLGLSDPRLRRALQMTQLLGQYGNGLQIDGQGRLSVDGAALFEDESTIRTLLAQMAQMMKAGGSNMGFPSGEDIFSLFAESLVGERFGKLEAATGVNDAVSPSVAWIPGDKSILRRLLGMTPKVKVYERMPFSDVRIVNTNTPTYLPHTPTDTSTSAAETGALSFPAIPDWETIMAISFDIQIDSYTTSLYNVGSTGGDAEAATIYFHDARWHQGDDVVGEFTEENPYLRSDAYRQISSESAVGFGEDTDEGDALKLLYSFRGGGEFTAPDGGPSNSGGFDNGGQIFYNPKILQVYSSGIPRHHEDWVNTSNKFKRIGLRVKMSPGIESDTNDTINVTGTQGLRVFYMPQLGV